MKGTEHASTRKLLELQHQLRHRLGDCSFTCTGVARQEERAGPPFSHLRLGYLLGFGDDCPLYLSATTALEVYKLKSLLPRLLQSSKTSV